MSKTRIGKLDPDSIMTDWWVDLPNGTTKWLANLTGDDLRLLAQHESAKGDRMIAEFYELLSMPLSRDVLVRNCYTGETVVECYDLVYDRFNPPTEPPPKRYA